MTFHLALTLYGMFTACLAAAWLGWQTGEHLRWHDDYERRMAARRAAIWRRIHAARLAEGNPGVSIDAIERIRSERRRRANARMALRAMQSGMAATDGR